MIKYDDQPPMSPAADAWAESVLIKSDKLFLNVIQLNTMIMTYLTKLIAIQG